MLRILIRWLLSLAQKLMVFFLFSMVFLLGVAMALMAVKGNLWLTMETWLNHVPLESPPLPPEVLELKEDLEAMKLRMKQVEAENQSLLEAHFQPLVPQSNLSTRHLESITSRITKSLPRK